MTLSGADILAERIIADLRPVCERIEVVGSVRRRKQTVKDVEVLCVPKVRKEQDLFGTVTATVDQLTAYLRNAVSAPGSAWQTRYAKDGKRGAMGIQIKHLTLGGKAVDVFSCAPEVWGWHQVIRTGPAAWNVRMLQYLAENKPMLHATIERGIFDNEAMRHLPLFTEQDVFAALGCDYVEPERRR